MLNKPQKHIVHKAIVWKKMLEDGEVGSLSEIARNEGLTRTRDTQRMKSLLLQEEFITLEGVHRR